jgi:hypothetical protein
MNDEKIFDALSQYLWSRHGARVAFKNESPLMRLLGKILFFNPQFMTSYITTIGKTIYFPTKEDILGGKMWDVLAHEGVHIIDSQKKPIRYSLSYLFPQILSVFALFSLLAFFNTGLLLFLLFLIALAPWPARWRVGIERRAYLMSMVCDSMRYGEAWIRSDYYKLAMAQMYIGPGYYFMMWDKNRARHITAIDAGLAQSLLHDTFPWEPYEALIEVIRSADTKEMVK